MFLIALGLTKKLLVADYLADNLVNRVFDFPKLYSGAETLVEAAHTLREENRRVADAIEVIAPPDDLRHRVSDRAGL